MAVIDLKNVTVKVRGGTAGTPPVIKIAKASATTTDGTTAGTQGATTITVASLATKHYIGERFTIEGDADTVYTLKQDAESAAAVLTFTPVLKMATYSAAKDLVWVAGYGENTTHLAIDNGSTAFTGTVAKGSIVNFGTDTTDYVITTGGTNPTFLEISPGLKNEVADNATVTIITSPPEIEAVLGDGDVTFSEKKTREYKLNRGVLNTVRNADEEPMEVSLNSLTWEFIRSTGNGSQDPSLEEAIKGIGPAANWASTSSDPCEPYACDIIFENVPNCGNTGQSETIIFPDFRWETFDYNSKDGSISCTGKCNATEALKIRDIA